MAQRVHVVLEDDVDQTLADETLSFSLDGVSYQIDLSAHNAEKLRQSLAVWIGHARRSGGRKSAGRKSTGRNVKGGSAIDVRAWARANGMQVNARGRVPTEIREAYEKANV